MIELVSFFSIEPKYKKPNGLTLHDIDREDLPLGFAPVSRCAVLIPPNEMGGNHAHKRREGFIALGEGLELFWLDEEGSRHSAPMYREGQPLLIVVESMVPHAIKNNSEHPAFLLEYADLKQEHSPVVAARVL